MAEVNAVLFDLVARGGGILAFVLGCVAIAAMVKSGIIFRDEVRNIDRLVAEYVRCRDYLLGNRRPSMETGWRTVEGDAFREAWRNFNTHVEVIRRRHLRRSRPWKALLAGLLLVALGDSILWMVGARARDASFEAFITTLGMALTWILSPLVGWFVVRLLDGAVLDRTSSNSLISPWPADGGVPEKQFSFDKFLPVEMDPRQGEAATPEATF